MFEQVLDSVRKMSESTIQMQQEFYKQWMSHLPTTAMMSPASTGGGVAEQAQSLQKRWMDSVTELMNKQREALDCAIPDGDSGHPGRVPRHRGEERGGISPVD